MTIVWNPGTRNSLETLNSEDPIFSHLWFLRTQTEQPFSAMNQFIFPLLLLVALFLVPLIIDDLVTGFRIRKCLPAFLIIIFDDQQVQWCYSSSWSFHPIFLCSWSVWMWDNNYMPYFGDPFTLQSSFLLEKTGLTVFQKRDVSHSISKAQHSFFLSVKQNKISHSRFTRCSQALVGESGENYLKNCCTKDPADPEL